VGWRAVYVPCVKLVFECGREIGAGMDSGFVGQDGNPVKVRDMQPGFQFKNGLVLKEIIDNGTMPIFTNEISVG
jgi:hypothetical protein